MKNFSTVTVFILAVMVAVASCASKKVVPSSENERHVIKVESAIHAIEATSGIFVKVTQGRSSSVTVDYPSNLAGKVNVTVSGGKLLATMQNVNVAGRSNVTVNVTTPNLRSITVTSAARVAIDNGLKQRGSLTIGATSAAAVDIAGLRVSSLDVSATSSANISIVGVKSESIELTGTSAAKIVMDDVDCDRFTGKATSSATVDVSGVCNDAEYQATSAATVDASALKAKQVSRAAATSGASINCSGTNYGRIAESSGGRVRAK